MDKKTYKKPVLKVVEFRAECGYAQSGLNMMNMETVNGLTTFMNSWDVSDGGFVRNEQYGYTDDSEDMWGF